MSTLKQILDNCLNILRDNEGLTGDKALRNISYLLVLKLIEPHIGKDIDFENYNYYDLNFDDSDAEHFKTILRCSRYSVLLKTGENNYSQYIEQLWLFLSRHPATNKIFLDGYGLNIRRELTLKIILHKINQISETNVDVLGDTYEAIIKDLMTGKVLGQFFTPPAVKELMLTLINPQIRADGTVESCADPTMGTGGLLISYMRAIRKQAEEQEIKLDWRDIKDNAIYGREIEPDTYQLAMANLLISSGYMFDRLDRKDSIREIIDRKFDIVMANPPFGIKGLKYDEFNYSDIYKYIPIKSHNAVSLFIQAIIYMLKIEGRCAIVLPDGQDLFSKTNKSLIMIREYLMKTCDLREIVYMPAGIFEYTTIKTVVFYFVKKVEGVAVLDRTEIHHNQKYTYKYQFITDNHATSIVQFYQYDYDKKIKSLLVEVPIDNIVQNKYALNYAEYMPKIETNYIANRTIQFKTLGEVCEFLPKSKRQASYGKSEGIYPFYTSSQNCNKYCDEYDYNEECLVIGTGGNANIKYSSKFSCSTDNIVMKITTEYLTKYIYYYLSINIGILQNGFVGLGLQHISKEYITNIQIPIPSLECQTEIVEYCEYNDALIKQLESEIENNKKQAREFLKRALNTSVTESELTEHDGAAE